MLGSILLVIQIIASSLFIGVRMMMYQKGDWQMYDYSFRWCVLYGRVLLRFMEVKFLEFALRD